MSVTQLLRRQREVGRWQSEARPSKRVRPYLKSKLKVKGLGVWFKSTSRNFITPPGLQELEQAKRQAIF